MRHLLIFILITFLSAAAPVPAPAEPVEPVDRVLATSIRYDLAETRLVLGVTGTTAAGATVHRERPLDGTRYGVYSDESWVSNFERYDVTHYCIVYRFGGRRYLVGSLETYVYKAPGREPVRVASLAVPWYFRTDVQEFELDFDVKDLPTLEDWKAARAVPAAPDPAPADGCLQSLKSRALSGDEAAVDALKERGLWN